MSETRLSDVVALRIGLAVRALPDTTPAQLISVLKDAVGLPPTLDKLSTLTVKKLQKAAQGGLAEVEIDDLKKAVAILQGKQDAIPLQGASIEAYQQGELPDSIRVAIASNGGEILDGHFGSCSSFLIYQVSGEALRLVDIRPAANPPVGEDKNRQRAEQLADCQLLYLVSIGGPAAAKVVKQGIHPVKLVQGGNARELLSILQQRLLTAPAPWLAKSLGVEAEGRVLFEREAS